MLERLREIFRSDRIKANTAVFPDIQTEALARELRVDREGAATGKRDAPPTASGTLDSHEMAIVERIERIRRIGLDNFEDHRSAYAQRLSRAGDARREIVLVADKACGDFQAETKLWMAELVNPHRRVTDAYAHLKSVRAANRLDRPTYHHSGWPTLLAISFALIVVEAILHSQTFSGVHEMGLLGGALLAILIAVINVTASGIGGGFARMINHVSPMKRSAGALLIVGWIVFDLVFNLGVAHLRDAMASATELEEAARLARTRLFTDPFGITSMQSWLLFVFGAVVSLAAFLKAYHAFDPYPGYSRVEKLVEQARHEYTDKLDAALQVLEARRTEAIDGLNDARQLVESNINEAIDALYGSNALTAQLQTFLNQCDVKVQTLLAKYREANIAARKTDAPAHFNAAYHFPPFAPSPIQGPSPETYDDDRRKISEAIDKAIEAISQEYRKAVEAYPGIEELEGEASGAVRYAEERENRKSGRTSRLESDTTKQQSATDVTSAHEGLSVLPGGKARNR